MSVERRDRQTPDNTKRLSEDPVINTLDDTTKTYVQNDLQKGSYTTNDISQAVQDIQSGDQNKILKGVIIIRKLLSIETNPPIDEIIQTGVCPKLIEIAQNSSNAYAQFEALWALTNVASGNQQQTQLVVDLGLVTILITVLGSTNLEVVDQAVWALGNIAGDSSKLRDYVISQGAVDKLVTYFDARQNLKKKCSRDLIWTMSNLVRGKPSVQLNLVKPLIRIFAIVIKEYQSEEDAFIDALWGLSYISDGPNDRISAVLEQDIVDPLGASIKVSNKPAIITPALRTIGNIATGDLKQTQKLYENENIIPNVLKLLDHEKKNIRKEALWLLSNITAETGVQIEMVIHNTENLQKIMKLAQNDTIDVAKEAFWTISNMAVCATPAQINKLVENGYFEAVNSGLEKPDPKVVLVVLEGLEAVLKHGENVKIDGENQMVLKVEEGGILDQIEKLQSHQNMDVYKKALGILEKYFDSEEEEDVEMQDAPAGGKASAFSFN